MLVVAHDNHIVRHDSLLFPVIISRVLGRHVIIHREDKPPFPAGNRHFPDKLDIVRHRFRLQALEIQVKAVKAVVFCLLHHICNQLLPSGGFGQQDLGLDVFAAFFAEIVQHGPDLKSLLMGLIYIASAGQGFIIPIIAAERKPGGHNHIDSLRRL